MLQEFYGNDMHKYICPKSLTSAGSSRYYALVIGSLSNLPLLTIGDYYYSHNKMMKRKWRLGRDMVWVLVGVTGCVPWPMGLSLVTLFSLFVSIKDRPLLWMVVRSQTYYPEHILTYESRNARYALVVGSSSFRINRRGKVEV